MKKYKRICKRCGQEFETNSPRQLYCLQLKETICPYCGNTYLQKCEAQPKTYCGSKECLHQSRIQHPKTEKQCKICGKLFLPKSSHQNICGETSRHVCKICGKSFDYKCEIGSDPSICYGCRNHYYTKICKYCGKEFITNVPNEEICHNIHYRFCEICGKKFEVPRNRLFDITLTCCSKECSNKKRNIAIKEALSNLEGNWNKPTTTYKKVCEYCGKEFETHYQNQKYCNNTHYAICEVCGKSFEINKYQISNNITICSEDCRREKSLMTILRDRYNTWKEFSIDPKMWIKSKYNHKPTYFELSRDLNMSPSIIQQKLSNMGLINLVDKYVSTMEQEVHSFIHTISNTEIQLQNRKIIAPKELDLYLPEYKLGIECNPTSTHNSSVPFMNKSDIVDSNYHKMKSDLANKNGIFLFHIFGYEWTHKRPIIQSMIKNLLGTNSIKVYARSTDIREVSFLDANVFLADNHRQGPAASKVRLGLYYNNELVSLMTFGSLRSTISRKLNSNIDNCWELIRFCNKLDTTVVGGASKLFSHFVNQYNPKEVISFSDIAHTSGKLYQILEFKEDHRSDPGYVWVDTSTDIAYNRVNTQKHNLKKILNDNSIDLENMTEQQIMVSHGYVQVFDSGTIVWKYK